MSRDWASSLFRRKLIGEGEQGVDAVAGGYCYDAPGTRGALRSCLSRARPPAVRFSLPSLPVRSCSCVHSAELAAVRYTTAVTPACPGTAAVPSTLGP